MRVSEYVFECGCVDVCACVLCVCVCVCLCVDVYLCVDVCVPLVSTDVCARVHVRVHACAGARVQSTMCAFMRARARLLRCFFLLGAHVVFGRRRARLEPRKLRQQRIHPADESARTASLRTAVTGSKVTAVAGSKVTAVAGSLRWERRKTAVAWSAGQPRPRRASRRLL